MRFYQLLLPIFIGLHLKSYQALVTYKSTLPLNAIKPDAGLKLIKESIKKDTNFEKGITICIRFNFLALGEWSPLFTHDVGLATDWHSLYAQSMFFARVGYKKTFFIFGTMASIVKDVDSNTFLLWSTNRWHSICVACDRTNSHITFVKVIKCAMYFLFIQVLWQYGLWSFQAGGTKLE